jgi:pimeloyl-ACP methyl ester carboxylesterase
MFDESRGIAMTEMTEEISDKSDADIGKNTRRRRRRRAIAIAVAAVGGVLLVLNSVSVLSHTSEATGDQIIRLDDGDLHVTEDGPRDAPVLLLIHGFAGSTAWWNPVVPMLQQRYRVIRVDLLGHGASAKPAGGYDIPAQGRRVGAVLDQLRVDQAVIVGHSTGGAVATALAEQRPDVVAALVLIDTGPSQDAFISQGFLGDLVSDVLLVPVVGETIWQARSEAAIRNGLETAFTRKVDVPDEIIADVGGMTYRAFTATSREALHYLEQRPLPARLADLHVPVMVIFGTDDRRWRSSSADDYRVIPNVRIELLAGVGHTPMLEDPARTSALLATFAATSGMP